MQKLTYDDNSFDFVISGWRFTSDTLQYLCRDFLKLCSSKAGV